MKVLVVLISLLLSSGLHAQQWFNVNANCQINAATTRCMACNYSYNVPIYCNVNARAVSSYGYWMNNYNQGVVHPGNCIYVYINANNPSVDPLVSGSANAQCRF
ncbi:MAG: hypothetical protein MK008_06310 [Bdellovibrionales bacterium]|nr:hypothetical protein [Bdellovibrionales bacterium]